MDNNIELEVAMKSMEDGHVEIFPTLDLETWAVVSEIQHETQETEGDGGEAKVIDNANNEVGAEVIGRSTNTYGSLHTHSRDLGINRCKTQEKDGGGEEARVEAGACDKEVKQSRMIEVDVCYKVITKEMDMDNTTMENADQDENFFTHVPETWAFATERNMRPKRWKVAVRGRTKTVCTTRRPSKALQRDDDGQVGHVDPKDVITTSIVEENGCEAHDIREVVTKNDIKEVAMDDTTKVFDQRHMESSMLVPETWAVATERQRETQETEGGDKGKVIAGVHDKDGEQSMTKDDEAKLAKRISKLFLGTRSRHLTRRALASRSSSLT